MRSGRSGGRRTASSRTAAWRCASPTAARSTGARRPRTSPRARFPASSSVAGDVYRRTIVVDGDPGVLELHPGGDDHLVLVLHLPHWEELIHLVARARRIAGLDLDLDEPAEHLGARSDDRPAARGPSRPAHAGNLGSVRDGRARDRRPAGDGRRGEHDRGEASCGGTALPVPGLSASRAHARLSDRGDAGGGRPRRARAPARAAGRDPLVRARGVPRTRSGSTAASASSSSSPPSLRSTGSGSWTAHYVALRLGEPDAFPATDLGLRRAVGALGASKSSPSAGGRGARSRRRISGCRTVPSSGPGSRSRPRHERPCPRPPHVPARPGRARRVRPHLPRGREADAGPARDRGRRPRPVARRRPPLLPRPWLPVRGRAGAAALVLLRERRVEAVRRPGHGSRRELPPPRDLRWDGDAGL